VVLKLWALGQTGALSVAASLADSAMDLMVSLGAMAAILYAARPADEDHAFGHTSVEDLAALGQSVFILGLGRGDRWGRRRPPSGTRTAAAGLRRRRGHGRDGHVHRADAGLSGGKAAWRARPATAWWQADRLHYLGDLLPNHRRHPLALGLSRFGIGSVDSVVALGGGGAWPGGAQDRQGCLGRADGPSAPTPPSWRASPSLPATGPACAAFTTSRPAPPAAGSS
jgi:ferrous-iron efflux pump FieF